MDDLKLNDLEFRDYLEITGGEKALWDVLIELDKMKIKPDDPIDYIRENLDVKLTKKFADLKTDIHLLEEEIEKLSEKYPVAYKKFLKWKQKTARKRGKAARSVTGKTTIQITVIPPDKMSEHKTIAELAEKTSVKSFEEKRPIRPSVMSNTSKTSKTSKISRRSQILAILQTPTIPEEDNPEEAIPATDLIEEILAEAPLEEQTAQQVHGDVPSQLAVDEEMLSKSIIHDRNVTEPPSQLDGDNFSEEQTYEVKSVEENVDNKIPLELEKNDSEPDETQNKWWKCC